MVGPGQLKETLAGVVHTGGRGSVHRFLEDCEDWLCLWAREGKF